LIPDRWSEPLALRAIGQAAPRGTLKTFAAVNKLIAAIPNLIGQSESSYCEKVTRAAALFYFPKKVPPGASGIFLLGKVRAKLRDDDAERV
jgi:hypothetical protein